MKNKNAGMSLVEIVVVIAMIAILAGLSAYGVGQISGYRARECAKKISSSLSANKITALGKAKQNGKLTWKLYQDASDGCFYVDVTFDKGESSEYVETTKVSKSRVNVIAKRSDGTQVDVSSDTLEMYFNRSTGALCEVSPVSHADRTDITQISVSYGTRDYNVDIVPATGKVKQK